MLAKWKKLSTYAMMDNRTHLARCFYIPMDISNVQMLIVPRTFSGHEIIQCHRRDQTNVHHEDGQICQKRQICTAHRQEAVAKQGDDDQDASQGFDGFASHGGCI